MENTRNQCLLCGGHHLVDLFRLNDVPVLCNQLWPDFPSARAAPRGDLDLVVCEDCTLIFNRAFDAGRLDYAPGYENALHFSPVFQAFAGDLAARLVNRHGLRDGHVVEIGCGDGHMLDLMVENGAKSAVGFDPSVPETRRGNVTIFSEYFVADRLRTDVSAILCRHVLEHLSDPLQLLADVRNAIGDRECAVYFEVPNAEWMLESCSIWDVIYEHVTYWTIPAIRTLFRRAGFEPTDIEPGFGGQFLMVEAVPAEPHEDRCTPAERERVIAAGEAFANAIRTEVDKWRGRLETLGGDDRRAVIWGAGSKGITFANAAGMSSIAALVDINPRKHGLVAPGVGIAVASPDDLAKINPDLVLISNRQYETEIRATVHDLGLKPTFGLIAG